MICDKFLQLGEHRDFLLPKHGYFTLFYARYCNDYSRQKKPLTGAVLNRKDVRKDKSKTLSMEFFYLQSCRSRAATLTKEKTPWLIFPSEFCKFFPEQLFSRTPT